MGRRLSTWLVLLRLFQVLGSFIPAAMNGWLLYFIYTSKLGPSDVMLILEILVRVIHLIVTFDSNISVEGYLKKESFSEMCLSGLSNHTKT